MTTARIQKPTMTSTTQPQDRAKHASRLASIDIVRGFAMMMMLLAHSAWPIQELSYRVHYTWNSGEPVGIAAPGMWMGLVAAFATPTFFLLAGFGIALFEASRIRRGWSQGAIIRFLLIRGTVLIVLDVTILSLTPWNLPFAIWESNRNLLAIGVGIVLWVVTWRGWISWRWTLAAYLLMIAAITVVAGAWSLPTTDWEPHRFFVLLAIGLCLWCIAFLRLLQPRILALIALMLTFATQLIYYTTAIPTEENLLRSVMLYPSPADTIDIGFPVLSWLPVMILGYLTTRYIIPNRDQFGRVTLAISSTFALIWVVLVATNGFGRLYVEHPLIATRRPPGLDYLAFYLCLAYFMLYVFHTRSGLQESRVARGLAILGQTALFFYAIHIYAIVIVGHPLVHNLPFGGVPLSLLIVVVASLVLYPICAWYRYQRRTHPRFLQYF